MFELHSAPTPFAPACAVFDCDGVLLDSETLWGEIQADMFKRYQVPLTPDLEASLVGISAGDLADRLAALTPLASEFDGSPEAFRDSVYTTITTTEYDVVSRGVTRIDGALETIKLLSAKIPVAVASNSGGKLLTQKLTGFGYAPYLDTWVSFHDVENGKPAPDIYREAVRRLGFAPEQALTVEDSITGMRAATSAGTNCLIYQAEPDAATPTPLLTAGIGRFSSFTDPAFLAQLEAWVGHLPDRDQRKP
ncbi:MAG: HAD family phosphatase [Rothia sp. (in: high G+C Gram-positive bacteria)]|nr:HAD family phosphatase [Rothia sp. (in: high G+C Gram-positive bacteria)]